jgi:glycosyltransferase involved in cell wall biosynthesis
LASGRPIVSNAVGEVKSVLENEQCGLTCEPQDLDSFVQNVLTLLDKPELQERLGQKARQAAENKYSWSKISSDLMGAYTGLTK